MVEVFPPTETLGEGGREGGRKGGREGGREEDRYMHVHVHLHNGEGKEVLRYYAGIINICFSSTVHIPYSRSFLRGKVFAFQYSARSVKTSPCLKSISANNTDVTMASVKF